MMCLLNNTLVQIKNSVLVVRNLYIIVPARLSPAHAVDTIILPVTKGNKKIFEM